MTDQEPYKLCPYCRKRVEETDPSVVYAREQVEIDRRQGVPEIVDGGGGFFHPNCPPEAIGWRRRKLPVKHSG